MTAGTALYSVSSSPKPKPAEDTVHEIPRDDDKTYEIIVKRDDAANNPAEKVAPQEMLSRMRVHATEVRRRGMRVVEDE